MSCKFFGTSGVFLNHSLTFLTVLYRTLPCRVDGQSAENMVDKTPKEFVLEEFNVNCKLSYEGKDEGGKYLLWIDGKLVNDLPIAPPIPKDSIPVVCQSDILLVKNNVTTRVTYQVFIEGIMSTIIADHNARGLTSTLEVDGKIYKQWDGIKIEEFAKHPYTFSHLNQKFVLSWVIEEFDSGLDDMFALEANGTPLSKLYYLDPGFKLVEEEVAIFDGYVMLDNG